MFRSRAAGGSTLGRAGRRRGESKPPRLVRHPAHDVGVDSQGDDRVALAADAMGCVAVDGHGAAGHAEEAFTGDERGEVYARKE